MPIVDAGQKPSPAICFFYVQNLHLRRPGICESEREEEKNAVRHGILVAADFNPPKKTKQVLSQ